MEPSADKSLGRVSARTILNTMRDCPSPPSHTATSRTPSPRILPLSPKDRDVEQPAPCSTTDSDTTPTADNKTEVIPISDNQVKSNTLESPLINSKKTEENNSLTVSHQVGAFS